MSSNSIIFHEGEKHIAINIFIPIQYPKKSPLIRLICRVVKPNSLSRQSVSQFCNNFSCSPLYLCPCHDMVSKLVYSTLNEA